MRIGNFLKKKKKKKKNNNSLNLSLLSPVLDEHDHSAL
jgi:hypothetical protein